MVIPMHWCTSTCRTGMLQHALGASQRIMMNLRPAILDQGLEAGS